MTASVQDERITSVFSYSSNLVVYSKETAKQFLHCIGAGQSVEIPNVAQMVRNRKCAGGGYWYYTRDKEGKLRYAYSHYGQDPILADPIVLIDSFDEKLAIESVYGARKSVNAYLHPKE